MGRKRSNLNTLDTGIKEAPNPLKEIVFMSEKFMGTDAAAGLSIGAGVIMRSNAGV
jgi:hypothetical protein